MDTTRSSRRALLASTFTLSSAFACALSIGCSSNGSSFDTGMGGSGGTNPTSVTGGSVSNPTSATGGTQSNPTGAMGGQTTTGGVGTSGSSTGGVGTAGDAPLGGQTQMGGSGGSGGGNTGPVCPKPPGPNGEPPICHEFIANDNGTGFNRVNYVNEFTSKNPGGVVWVKPVGHATPTPENSPRTIEIVDNPKGAGGKAILVSVNDGYVELDPATGNKLVDVTVQFTGVTGACRMPDGQTALGTNAAIRIVNANGVQSRSFNLPAGLNLRAINRNPNTGDFWLSKTETLYQISDSGQIKWQGSMGAGTKGYAVWWREGGGAYGTTGETHEVVELDGNGQILQHTGGDQLQFKPLKLDFFSGFVRRPNGNYIVANWLGHNGNPDANTPEIIEFQPGPNGGTAIWTWGNQSLARQITNVYVFQ